MRKNIFISSGLFFAVITGFLSGTVNNNKGIEKKPGNGSVAAKPTPEKTRRISTEEYQFALSLFEREFPPRDQLFISDETGAGGAFYVRPTVNLNVRMCMGKYFENCLATAESKSVFAHELTHAWQIEHYGLLWFGKEAFCNQIVSLEPYLYRCDVNKTIGDYNAEQQGEIVRHYFGGNECAATIAKKTLTSKTWKLLIGSDGRDAAVDENGNYYLINDAGLIYKYTGNDWEQLPGSDGYAIAANAGKVWMANTAGVMYELQHNKWVKMDGSDAKDIAITSEGAVWMINKAGQTYKYANSQWKLFPGSDAARVAAGVNNVWMVNSAGKIYNREESNWKQMPGSEGRDIAVSNDGSVFLTNKIGKIYKWTGTAWEQLDGSDGKTIAANNKKVFMVNTKGRLYYTGY